MTDRDSLLRALCETPDDDLPRLVFADWLDENGESERAEHIRLQVRLAELYANPDIVFEDSPSRTPFTAGSKERQAEIRRLTLGEVRARERRIWDAHTHHWLGELPPIPGVAWFSEFHRGFTERVTVAADGILVRHAVVFDSQPIRHLTVERFNGVTGFAGLPFLGRLKSLTLRTNYRDDESSAVDELLRAKTFHPGVLLDFCHGTLEGDRAAKLARKFRNRLRRPSR